MPHAYTEQAQRTLTLPSPMLRTLTRPLPEGEEVERPAFGLFAELGWVVTALGRRGSVGRFSQITVFTTR